MARGTRADAYPDALALMEARAEKIRLEGAPELVWLVEHPPLYTAGTSARAQDLVDPSRFPVFDAGRGGEFTYHGPGQRVAYVMLDLKRRQAKMSAPLLRRLKNGSSAHWRASMCAANGARIVSGSGWSVRPASALWSTCRRQDRGYRNPAAQVGQFSRHRDQCRTDLTHFSGIIPCGIAEHGVTSLVDLGLPVTMADLDVALKASFDEVFGG
jgi:lipoyl(octanoyl) transferase